MTSPEMKIEAPQMRRDEDEPSWTNCRAVTKANGSEQCRCRAVAGAGHVRVFGRLHSGWLRTRGGRATTL